MSEQAYPVEPGPELGEPLDGLNRRSYSQLSTYSQCGEQYRLTKLVKPRVVERPALWNTLGTGIHWAFEEAVKKRTYEDMHDDFEIGYEDAWNEQIKTQPDLSQWLNPYRGTVLEAKETVRAKGHAQIDRFFEWLQDPEHGLQPMYDYDEETGEASAWTEVKFELILGRSLVVGSIDLVEEGYVPIDYKSGKATGSKPRQLGIYALALKEIFGGDSTTGQFFHTSEDRRATFGRSEHHDLTRYSREYLTDLFEAMEKGVENGVFIPNPGEACGICGVKDFCREKGDRPIPLDWASIEEPWWTSI